MRSRVEVPYVQERLVPDAGEPLPPPDPERDVTLLLRAAWLLSQHPEYAHPGARGYSLRRVRIDLLAMARRLEEERR